MTAWREHKTRLRQAVHDTFKVSAIYISPVGVETPVGVRVFPEVQNAGDLEGGADHRYAIQPRSTPELLFWLADGVVPERGAIVSIAADEAYRIEYDFPVDGPTVRVQVAPLEAHERSGLAVPS